MLLHPIVHLALLAWYFLMKAVRDKRRLALVMCAIGILAAAADLVLMMSGYAGLPRGRVFLGIVIDMGLVLLFAWRWAEAARKAER